jgi:hypothetical protein
VPNENARRPSTRAGPERRDGAAAGTGLGRNWRSVRVRDVGLAAWTGGQGARPKPLYTKAGGEALAANPLYDYVFLNLEGAYDSEAVKNIAEGLRAQRRRAASRSSFASRRFMRIRRRRARASARSFAAGGDGVTFPHVESLDEAKQILALLQQEKVTCGPSRTPRARSSR